MNVFDSGSFCNGGGFIILSFSNKCGVEGNTKLSNEFSIRHGFECGFLINELSVMVMVVSGFNGDSKGSDGGEFHYDI